MIRTYRFYLSDLGKDFDLEYLVPTFLSYSKCHLCTSLLWMQVEDSSSTKLKRNHPFMFYHSLVTPGVHDIAGFNGPCHSECLKNLSTYKDETKLQ